MSEWTEEELLASTAGLAQDVFHRLMPGCPEDRIPEIGCRSQKNEGEDDSTVYLVVDGVDHELPVGDLSPGPGAFDALANRIYDVLDDALLPPGSRRPKVLILFQDREGLIYDDEKMTQLRTVAEDQPRRNGAEER